MVLIFMLIKMVPTMDRNLNYVMCRSFLINSYT